MIKKLNFTLLITFAILAGLSTSFAAPARINPNSENVERINPQEPNPRLNEEFLRSLTRSQQSEAEFLDLHPQVDCATAKTPAVELWCQVFRDGQLLIK